MRPGSCSRIDMDTTGVLIVCKRQSAQCDRRTAEGPFHYPQILCDRAWCVKEDDGTVNAPIGRHPVDRKKMSINEKNGKEAVTHYHVLKRFRRFTYVEPAGDRADSSDPCSYGEHRSSASGRSGLRTCKGSVFRSSGSDTACRSPWHHPSVYRRIYGISRAASGIF